jgi:mono/diheme cytochrome c family protein
MNVKRNAILGIFLAALIVPTIVIAQGRGGGGRGAAVASNPNPPTSPVTGNLTNGKALYYNYSCYGCHGFNGETGRAFVGDWTPNLSTEDNFIKFLRGRANVAPPAPSTNMPNFAENTLSDKQAKDIYAYIRTFKSNAPPLQNISTLNEIVKAASRPYKP